MDREPNKTRSLILLNLSVVLFGFAGLFGKWIGLPALGVTFGRVFFSSISLALFMLITKQSFRVGNRRDLLMLILGGVITAIHWWSIFKSIQISTVTIGTITFSTFPLFVTFLEPLAYHEKLKAKNVMIAVIIIIGVIITVPEFSLENDIFKGILIGMISPAAYAVLAIMNKGFSKKYNSTLISFYEQGTACLVLLPFVLMADMHPTARDIGLLVIFGVVTTALAHTLFISCLKNVPAQLAGVCSSMETVYAIIFSMILLGEMPYLREVIGAVIIMGAVVYAQISEARDS